MFADEHGLTIQLHYAGPPKLVELTLALVAQRHGLPLTPLLPDSVLMLPLDIPVHANQRLRVLISAATQPTYQALGLGQADGVVFVADRRRHQLEETRAAFLALVERWRELGKGHDRLVVQADRAGDDEASSISELEQLLGAPALDCRGVLEANSSSGEVFPPLRTITSALLDEAERQFSCR